MLFTVVIPTYNRQDLLLVCLNSLSHYFNPSFQEAPCPLIEVIVSDDSYSLDLKILLRDRFPWCTYVKGPARGPAANRNHGAKLAKCEWVVFTDDDCIPQEGWLEAFAMHSQNYDVLEGRTLALETRTRADEECPINSSGGFLWSCNFAVRRDAFLNLGGFNEDFPAPAMEDVELNTRINKLGLNRLFVYNAIVLHPWRKRKGLSYAKAHSLSIATYIFLHPDQALRFSLQVQVLTFCRLLQRNIRQAIFTGIYEGLFRQIYLDLYSSYWAWNYVRKIRQE